MTGAFGPFCDVDGAHCAFGVGGGEVAGEFRSELGFDEVVEHTAIAFEPGGVLFVEFVEVAADEFTNAEIAKVLAAGACEFGEHLFGVGTSSPDGGVPPTGAAVDGLAVGVTDLPHAGVEFA